MNLFPLVDAHFHLDLFPDPASLVREIEGAQIHTIAVTNAPSVFRHTQELCSTTTFLHPAAGLHPELVESHGRELPELIRLIPHSKIIGEVGLDYSSPDPRIRASQRTVFSGILESCAAHPNKVLSIHSRRAVSDVLSALGPRFPGIPILHWFTGSMRELERAIEIGCHFSINAPMLRSRSGFALVQRMPSSRIVTETDGPFAKTTGRGAVPQDVAHLVIELARFWDLAENEVRRLILENFSRILPLPSPPAPAPSTPQ
ncbi:TatD family hydrolase [bacterium]|nr:TatD family hydrolase [bacterium]